MKTIWLKGVSSAEKKREVRQDFIQAHNLRQRLKELLEEKIEAKRSEVRKNNTYESPNWALVQADAVGYERALFEVISMIFDEKVQKEQNSE